MEFNKMKNILFFSSLGIISIFFLYMLRPLFYPLFWAAVIASIFYGLYDKLKQKIKYKNLSAAIVLLLVVIIIFVPLTLFGSLLVKESFDLYAKAGDKSSGINTTVLRLVTWTKDNLHTAGININESFWLGKMSEITTAITNFIFTSIKSLTENSLTFLVLLVIMLYMLYYFIRGGKEILKKAMRLFPLGDQHELMFYKKFTSAARAAIKGTLIIGLIQGTLGSLMFYIVGINGALIWGLAMMIFSVLIGSYFIWIPAGIIMLALGNVWQGIFILAFGSLVISTIDNILRPMLIGKDIKMHPLLIFMSTLGGVVAFGISGFVIGPVITALLMAFWELYEQYYQKELPND